MTGSLAQLQGKLGYEFSDPEQLRLALTHRSHGACHNERLEFLGDSILNVIIGETLYHRFPDMREGQLSRLRSQLVKGTTLAELAREFGLGAFLLLGEGERKSGGAQRESILADSLEAIIGAIYLEAGFESCRGTVLRWYHQRLAALSGDETAKDAKTRLQEWLQSRGQPLPEYVVVEAAGASHEQRFVVECRVAQLRVPTRAQANNRRVAEKRAAELALDKLQSVPGS